MFACVSLYAPWACRSQQRTLEPLETGVVNNLVGTENWTYVLCESSKYSELLSNHLSRPLTVSESMAWSSSSGSGLPASSGDLPFSMCPALRWQAHHIIMLSFLHGFGALSSSSCICKASTFMMKLSLSSEYLLCVCMYCVHMRVIGNTCTWVCMYFSGPRLVLAFFLYCSLLYALRQGLSPEPRTCWCILSSYLSSGTPVFASHALGL